MTFHINPSQQKLAEKLVILNDRSLGMLTRIYNIKKACSDPKSKPTFLSDRSLEAALRHITKKFPTIDIRGGGATFQSVGAMKNDIIKSLSLYYFTFVDLLDLKDHITELLTIMDACQVHFDITLNYDITSSYLNLVVNYVSLMILLSRVEDRKAVLGLFNTAHEMQNGNSDPSFPRLGQMILDYDPPLKKLSDEFIPHARQLVQALSSLSQVYMRRNLTAEQWRSAQMLSLVAAPQHMLHAAQTDTVLAQSGLGFGELWQKALEGNLIVRLFRDENLYIHQYIQAFFETVKGYHKKVTELKEFHAHAVQHACYLHRERRKFLRAALKELCLVLSDQPGLLGPKVLFVFMGLSFSRDEVGWLLRHADNWPQKTGSKSGKNVEDIMDRQIPELLFHMEELRGLIFKYSQGIIHNLRDTCRQYLSGYDSIALNELIQSIPNVPEDESIILSSFCNSVADLTVDGLGAENCPLWDFRGLRLDWCRLQAYTSVAKAPLKLMENRKLAYAMNTAVFHLKMVDFLDEMLLDTSDLSVYCFYTKQLEQQFQLCLEFPSQTRYICAYPQLCTHFMNALHELCPEERIHIGEKSLSFCNLFLEEMAKEAKNIITNISDQQCILADKLLPKHSARVIGEAMNQKKKVKAAAEKKGQAGANKTVPPLQLQLPGDESYRKNREEMTMMDKLYIALTELCFSINYYNQIVVWEHIFAPKEYLTQHLESRFNKAIVGMSLYNAERQEIAKPSELLNSVQAYMSMFETIENYVNVDVTRVFNNVLLQQTQPQDCRGEETITTLYTRWYLEVLLRRVSASQILFSPHLLSFVNNNNAEPPINFNAEEYTDYNELRSLAQLIGPYGIKFLCERLIWHVASQISELKKLVVQNKEVLRAMRTSFDKPERMRELFRQLTVSDATRKNLDVVDNLLQRVLSERIPFLQSSIADFKRTFPDEHPEQLTAFELCSAAGVDCSVDSALVNAIRAQAQSDSSSEEDYHLCCLMMVFIAVSLPKLARSESSFFKASLAAHLNNSHCIAKAVNAIAGAIFTLHARGDVQDRMKEFLALASGSLLRLNNEPDKEQIKSKESVYLLLDQLVDQSPWLTVDLLESCFPYILLRSSYHYCYKQEEIQGLA